VNATVSFTPVKFPGAQSPLSAQLIRRSLLSFTFFTSSREYWHFLHSLLTPCILRLGAFGRPELGIFSQWDQSTHSANEYLQSMDDLRAATKALQAAAENRVKEEAGVRNDNESA